MLYKQGLLITLVWPYNGVSIGSNSLFDFLYPKQFPLTLPITFWLVIITWSYWHPWIQLQVGWKQHNLLTCIVYVLVQLCCMAISWTQKQIVIGLKLEHYECMTPFRQNIVLLLNNYQVYMCILVPPKASIIASELWIRVQHRTFMWWMYNITVQFDANKHLNWRRFGASIPKLSVCSDNCLIAAFVPSSLFQNWPGNTPSSIASSSMKTHFTMQAQL